MAYTIDDARAQVLDHLDDVAGSRYARVAGVTDYTKVDRALRSALERCLDDYVAKGGDRFDEEVTVTTDATTGKVSLVQYDPIHIRAVLIAPDTTGALFPVDTGNASERGLPDLTARTLQVRLVRSQKIKLKPDGSDFLVGAVNGNALSWSAFDEWVCARAALQMGIKDNEMRDALVATIGDLQTSVLGQRRIPSGQEWPSQPIRLIYTRIAMSLRWGWDARTRTMMMFFNGYFGGAM